MRLSRRLPFALICVLLVAGCAPGPETGRVDPVLNFRPNILWIVAEDMSPNIPAFGDSTIQTPSLSRLADEGVRFTHVFATAGVCAPSRAAIATGLYPNRIGAQHMRTGPWSGSSVTPQAIANAAEHMPAGIPPYEALPPADVKMHSQYLREAGYYAVNNPKHDYQFRAPVTAWDESGSQAHWRGRKPGQPFFAIVNLAVTHESRIWSKADDSLLVDANAAVPVPPYLPETEVALQDVRRMYSNILELDRQVGEILDELEADGLLDSTIVFWYTDHGGPFPRQKRALYDSGLHVPMIIRFPGAVHGGSVDDRLISLLDLKPTILSLAGIEPPAYLDGQAFLGRHAADEPRQYVHAAADRFDTAYDVIRAVRDHRFKYIRNYRPERPAYLPLSYRERMPMMQEMLRLHAEGRLDSIQSRFFRETKPEEELYDLAADPHEIHNLADDPAYAEKLAELRSENDRWLRAIDDKGMISETDYVASIWPGGMQPETAAPLAEREGRRVTLRSQTEGASIGYQLLRDGEPLDTHWLVYTGPVALEPGESLAAVAHRIGYLASDTTFVQAEPAVR